MKILIPDYLVDEALFYAKISKEFTSNRHDFHEGGFDAKARKMFEGKLGEKAIKQLFIDNDIKFIEDNTSHDMADTYDFIVYNKEGNKLLIDVKTRTKSFHTRTLELVNQISKRPKNIYISVSLNSSKPFSVDVLGFAYRDDFLEKNRIQNQGYLDNYVLYDYELKEITSLLNTLQKDEK